MTIVKELNNLSKVVTGKEGKATTDAQAVKFIADNYEGGGETPYVLPTASADTLGGVKVGDNLSIDANGVLSATDTKYTAGTNITISDQNVISASGGSGNVAGYLLGWNALYSMALTEYEASPENLESALDDTDTNVISARTQMKSVLDEIAEHGDKVPVFSVTGISEIGNVVFGSVDSYKVGLSTDDTRFIEASFMIPFDETTDEAIKTLHIRLYCGAGSTNIPSSIWYITLHPLMDSSSSNL